jgi:hypothetical protein
MNMQLRETDSPRNAGNAPPGWRAKLVVALIVAAVTAAVTVFAIRYFTACGNCAPPAQRSAQV